VQITTAYGLGIGFGF